MKQTAVEWYSDRLFKILGYRCYEFTQEQILDSHYALEKAKEMEKQQKGYSEEEVLELVDALNKISQFSDVGNDFLAVVQIKSIAIDAIKQFKNK